MSDRVLIIAEAGVNHNGSLERALEMVDVAAEAGADVIKFQTFSADKLASKDAELADYQKVTAGSSKNQWELLKGLELTHEEFRLIAERAKDRGIAFLSTGFDRDELSFLISELHIPLVKIASGDLSFAPMLVDAGESGLPVILSTGMAEMPEIERALTFIAAGIAREKGIVSGDDTLDAQTLARLGATPEVADLMKERVTILHCTTQYPAPHDILNLRAMSTIGETFGLPIGYSDHSAGTLASVVAVTLGATMIEKHFTLDKTLEGPDHLASLDVEELHSLVEQIRAVPVILGSPVKTCQPVEVGNKAVVRRSLVASRDISAGDIIAESDIECQRPASGRTSFDFYEVIGAPASRHYVKGEHID
jgi:N-acetylneuraminate synthase